MTKRFYLKKNKNKPGVLDVDIMADGVEFPDGVTVLHWRALNRSTSIYESFQHMIDIHGLRGKTVVEFVD